MTAVKLEDARRVISAAEKKASEIGQPMNIAVADEGGNIVAHIRMDNGWIGSIDIALKKAHTSRAFEIETKELAKHAQSGGQFFGVHASNDGKIMIFAGGIPLKRDGKVVGAIGVSGGSGDQDRSNAADRAHLQEKDYPCHISIQARTSAFPTGTPDWTSRICMRFRNRETPVNPS
jgi:uncharacterized protein GlcG (DUF336 family)